VTKRKAGSRRAAAAAPPAQGWRYVESSALLAAILEDDDAAMASIRAPGQRITSALTLSEFSRAILRAQLSGRIDVQQQRTALLALTRFSRRCYIVNISDEILKRAGRPFPVEPIRTLDAIHLATAEALGEPPALTVIITRDLRIRDNAIALGYGVE